MRPKKLPPIVKSHPHRPTGRVLELGIACGVCESVWTILEETRTAILSVARSKGWQYITAWGWVCPRCVRLVPQLSDPLRKYSKLGPAPGTRPTRVNINVNRLNFD